MGMGVAEFSIALRKISAERWFNTDLSFRFLELFTIHTISKLSTFK